LQLNPKITIRLFTDGHSKGFGPGIAELIERIDSSGSLRTACAQMGMSYSKAWSIVKSCETSLGFKLLERTVGGESGGGSVVTENGHKMLECYRKLQKEIDIKAESLLRDRFGDSFPDFFQ
jgi:molybdate transport repressor ModE-like protein